MKTQWTAACEMTPSPLHRAIAELHQLQRLTAAFTCCVDGMLSEAEIPDDRLVELYGSIHQIECLRCKRTAEAHTVYPKMHTGGSMIPRLTADHMIPRCFYCNGELMPGVNAPGQMIRQDRLSAAFSAMSRCDLLIAVGTDLKDNPAANLCLHAHTMDIPYAIVHHGRTHHDGYAEDGMVSHRFHLNAAEVFPEAVAALRDSA